MAEVSGELIQELLRQLHQRFDVVDHKLGEVKSELIAIRGHQLSIQQDVHNIYSILGRYDMRLDRIERRLELDETPTLSA
jgi:tetrahydromethanopterin S-methyltransferase subunit G